MAMSDAAGGAAAPAIKLIYFDFGGRAESIRLALHVGGVPFEDARITEAEFASYKAAGKFPFGAVPVLEVNGVTYAQSVGLLRYCGRLGGLYPEAPVEAGLVVDQVVGGVEDLIVATVPFLFAGKAEKALVRAKLEGEVYPRFFGAFSRLLEQHGKGFFYGDQLTIADLAVYPVLHWITTSITTPESLGAYPPLSQLMARIEAHPRVADFYRREREREERKAAAVAAGAEGAGAGASDGGDGH